LVPWRGFFKQLLSTTTNTHPTKELLQYSVSVHLPGLPLGLLILLGLLFPPDFQRWEVLSFMEPAGKGKVHVYP